MSKTIQQQASESIEEEFHAAAPGFPVGTIPDDLARALDEDNLLAPELPEPFGTADAASTQTGEIGTLSYWGHGLQVEAFKGERRGGVTVLGQTVDNPREVAMWLLAAAESVEA